MYNNTNLKIKVGDFMKKYQVRKDYEYWYFDSQEEFFKCVDKLLEEKMIITNAYNLALEFENKILLSFINVNPSNPIEELCSLNKEFNLIKPDYSKSMLNIIASIKNKFGGMVEYSTNKIIDEILDERKYKNIVILLLDGMGLNILNNNLDKDSFLHQNHLFNNIAIYPSTTAASTTSTINGLAPIRTAWLGWENYFKEINRNLILFTGVNYETDEPTGFDTNNALPYVPFYNDLDVNGNIIQPDFSNPKRCFKDVLYKSLKLFKNNKLNIQYIYETEPDSLIHEFGCYHEIVKRMLKKIDCDLKWYSEQLPKDTLLIVSADHGHTNVSEIKLYACDTIMKMLKRKPSNDARCITFRVKDEYKAEFIPTFNKLFGYAYDIYPSRELIELGYFGAKEDEIAERCYDFLADFIAIGKADYYFNFKGENNIHFKSHHAGITSEEMIVPVIIYKKI